MMPKYEWWWPLLNVLPLRRHGVTTGPAELSELELTLNNSMSQLAQIHILLRESFKLKSSEMAGTITAVS